MNGVSAFVRRDRKEIIYFSQSITDLKKMAIFKPERVLTRNWIFH
jgi:hypothetical protein